MVDNLNYSKNLTGILGQVLRPLGFNKKGTRFILNQSYLEFSINLPRSRWNSLPDRPKNLSIYLEVESSDRKIVDSIPIFRPTKVTFPAFYGPFFLDNLDWIQKSNLMSSFTDEQLSEIDNYTKSINWYYDDDNGSESLISILNEARDQVIKVVLPTIDFAKNFQLADLETFNLMHEMRKQKDRLYLMQLDPL